MARWNRKFDWLIVGAGFTGATLAERIATQLGQRVLVIDQRNHVAGNAHDLLDSVGVMVHKYGPHLFHTNSKKVWDYLSMFTEWRPYSHKVEAEIDGVLVPVPFNLNSISLLFNEAQSERLSRRLIEKYGYGSKVTVLSMLKECTGELKELAEYVYEKVFLGYTTKQWGHRPEELSASVSGRVPIRVSHDNRYFEDTYQAMPSEGYTRMFQQMLSHPNIQVELNTRLDEARERVEFDRMIYTGPIDAFFECKHGHLPYRSLKFESHVHASDTPMQTVAQLNFPNEHEYTRTVEYRLITGQEKSVTTIVKEFPQEYRSGLNEPFYPIPKEANRAQYALYRQEADAMAGQVIFAGRLADYQYYNMDQVVARALSVFEQEVSRETNHLRGRRDAQSKPIAA